MQNTIHKSSLENRAGNVNLPMYEENLKFKPSIHCSINCCNVICLQTNWEYIALIRVKDDIISFKQIIIETIVPKLYTCTI